MSSFSNFMLFYSNELLGLEGMVKIKNPDENLLNGNQNAPHSDLEMSISINELTDSRRWVTLTWKLHKKATIFMKFQK